MGLAQKEKPRRLGVILFQEQRPAGGAVLNDIKLKIRCRLEDLWVQCCRHVPRRQ